MFHEEEAEGRQTFTLCDMLLELWLQTSHEVQVLFCLFVLSPCHAMLWSLGMDTQLIAHALSMGLLAANRNELSEENKPFCFVVLC